MTSVLVGNHILLFLLFIDGKCVTMPGDTIFYFVIRKQVISLGCVLDMVFIMVLTGSCTHVLGMS